MKYLSEVLEKTTTEEWVQAYDLNDAEYGVSSSAESFLMVFNNKAQAEAVYAWLIEQGGEYKDNATFTIVDPGVYESCGMANYNGNDEHITAFYLVSNQTD